jgi:Mce-associated membrane protein
VGRIGHYIESAVNADTDDATLVQLAEAEALAAEAIADAARARAVELRQLVPAGSGPSAPSPDGEAPHHAEGSPTEPADDPSSETTRTTRRPRVSTLIAGVAIAVTCAFFGASGCMVWQHQQIMSEQQRRAQFAAAAPQAVVALMSIDSSKAESDVQRIIENSTGRFRDDFQSAATDFVKAAQDSKAVTKATVRSSAVESMTADTAVVLVTADTTISNSAGADQQPRNWRLSVDVTQDGGQIKMSKVDLVS